MASIVRIKPSIVGAKGAVRNEQAKPLRVSAHLQYLQRLIAAGSLLPDAITSAATFCHKLVECEEASERDRNNAARTLATMAKMNADVAMVLDKIERLDSGQDTEQIGVRKINLTFDE